MSDADLRDPRIYLAAERTFLAWIRTGLALMAFGFVVARVGVLLSLASPPGTPAISDATSLWLGVILIVGGVGTCVAAAVRNARYVGAIDRGVFRAAFGSGLSVGLVVLITIVGAGILLALGW